MKNFMIASMMLISTFAFASVVDFEDLSLAADSYWNGSDMSGGFQSGNAYFVNNYNPDFFCWDGFAYSSKTDTVNGSWMNQYSAIAGSGVNGSSTYSVAYVFALPTLSLTDQYAGGATVEGLYVTNTTYAYSSMKNGDAYSKKFGGQTGNDADWFKLTIRGITALGAYSDAADFYLADYRFADNAQDYILDDWAWVNLSSLGNDIVGLEFSLSSSDAGMFGMNTPAYFAMDNLTIVPEPATLLLIGAGMTMIKRSRKHS